MRSAKRLRATPRRSNFATSWNAQKQVVFIADALADDLQAAISRESNRDLLIQTTAEQRRRKRVREREREREPAPVVFWLCSGSSLGANVCRVWLSAAASAALQVALRRRGHQVHNCHKLTHVARGATCPSDRLRLPIGGSMFLFVFTWKQIILSHFYCRVGFS